MWSFSLTRAIRTASLQSVDKYVFKRRRFLEWICSVGFWTGCYAQEFENHIRDNYVTCVQRKIKQLRAGRCAFVRLKCILPLPADGCSSIVRNIFTGSAWPGSEEAQTLQFAGETGSADSTISKGHCLYGSLFTLQQYYIRRPCAPCTPSGSTFCHLICF